MAHLLLPRWCRGSDLEKQHGSGDRECMVRNLHSGSQNKLFDTGHGWAIDCFVM